MQNLTKRLVVWAVVVAVILMVPLVAMQFNNGVNWTLSDFVIIGALLSGAAISYELLTMVVGKKYRLAVGIIIVLGVVWLWVELAVGLFTNWGS